MLLETASPRKSRAQQHKTRPKNEPAIAEHTTERPPETPRSLERNNAHGSRVENKRLTSNRRRGFPGSRGGGCARHSDAAILLTDAAAPASRGATASPGQRSGGVAGGGACAGAGARRAEAREGLWTTRSRRPRRGGREGEDAWRGVAAARPCAALAGDLIATGDERRGRAMSMSSAAERLTTETAPRAVALPRIARGRRDGWVARLAGRGRRARSASSGGGPARRLVLYSCRPVR